LITNVSHDIKTPLTSIVNYVDLIKKENITDEPLAEYIRVLDRQSARLKKLTELQEGRLSLHVDGDLFKVTLTFPLK
jgi:signal transduction histidine kinase